MSVDTSRIVSHAHVMMMMCFFLALRFRVDHNYSFDIVANNRVRHFTPRCWKHNQHCLCANPMTSHRRGTITSLSRASSFAMPKSTDDASRALSYGSAAPPVPLASRASGGGSGGAASVRPLSMAFANPPTVTGEGVVKK